MYHTIDICQDIAEKLKTPAKVYEVMEDQWLDKTLADGVPGIACFYAAMDHAFPDQKWDFVAHDYLKLALKRFEQEGAQNYALFTGLSGLCFAFHMCAKNHLRYQQVLGKLHELLADMIRSTLFQLKQHPAEAPISPHYYDLVNGLGGVISYLLLRKEDALIKECIQTLIGILKHKKKIENNNVPGWFVFPEESFILSLPYGITGFLSVLSIAYWQGIDVPYQREMIKEIASWLVQKQTMTAAGNSWPHTISLKAELNRTPPDQELYRDAWCYGTPAVASSLYLAGRALNDASLKTFSEQAYVNLFSKPTIEWNLIGPTFGFGRAGMLATTHCMSKMTHHYGLANKVLDLEKDLKRFYHPNHPFGFQSVLLGSQPNEYKWINNPGLLDGATGIALTLLSLDGRIDVLEWERIFLLK